jgi:hypothetical protein
MVAIRRQAAKAEHAARTFCINVPTARRIRPGRRFTFLPLPFALPVERRGRVAEIIQGLTVPPGVPTTPVGQSQG